VVKVIDFGIAKATGQPLTDKTLVSHYAQLIGTPLYMSPEQAQRSGLDVDTRSDVYALGVLLYELLTGMTPFDQERLRKVGYDEIRRIIREEEPARPSTLTRSAERGARSAKSAPRSALRAPRFQELDWIVMKALEKDRGRRYETASAFAADVERYLNDEPVLACPPSVGYRFCKFARRNKAKLAAAGLVLTILMVLGVVFGWVARDRAARQKALEREVARAIDEAQAYYRVERLPEAFAAVQRAEALLAGGGDHGELAPAVGQALTDVRLAARLEEIRLERAAVKDGNYDLAGVDRSYGDAFRRYGLDLVALDEDQAADRIRASAIKDRLVAGLDGWLSAKATGDLPGGERLLAVLRRADTDAWRNRFRAAFQRRDNRAVKDLARGPKVWQQSPATIVLLGEVLTRVGAYTLASEVLRRAQHQHPNDFWLNHDLAYYLEHLGPVQAAEAVGYYRAALALRPDSPGVHLNFGVALRTKGDLPGAIAAYRKALALNPAYAEAHCNLGSALQARDDLSGAIAAYRRALELKPGLAMAHMNLGNALIYKGDLPGALAALRRAVALAPGLALAHYNLGAALHAASDWPGAVTAYRKALALNPTDAEAHCNLGQTLRKQGEFRQAVVALRRGHALGSKRPGWRYASARWVRECEGLAELDGRLPSFLTGKTAPANADERIKLAEVCYVKHLHRAAARFYEEGFAAKPSLLAAQRDNAAGAAALAGCGQGKDAAQLDERERARLRSLALRWLHDELASRWLQDQLAGWTARKENNRATLEPTLRHWQRNPDLAGVRDPDRLAKLPRAERERWRRFWAEVAKTLHTLAKGPSQKGDRTLGF
jgi:serine/threonine-protein kinase